MQAEKEQLEKLLVKYLQGNASEEEVKFLHQWIWQLDINEQKLFQNAVEEEQTRLMMRAKIRSVIQPKTEAPVRKLSPFPSWLRAVAASILLLLVVMVGYHYMAMEQEPLLSFSADGSRIKEVTLPDGTRVTLNLFSKLLIKGEYNEQERRVELIGEAFFDVKKDSLRPFIVESGSVNTHVLGTAFNVEAYGGEQQTRVSLLRGKVRVQESAKDGQNSELVPGQMLVYDRQKARMRTESVAVENIAGWLNSRIIFNDAPLKDAIGRLVQRSGLELQFEENISLEGKFVTGEYQQVESAEEILQAILLVHNLHLKEKGGKLYVTH